VDDEGRLVGCLDAKLLLTKPRNARLANFVERVKVHIEPTRDREEAARLAIAYDLPEVPVVDASGRFLGVVTLDDLLDIVVSEFSEDLLKYGGFIEVIKGSYIAQRPIKLALKRAPMLIYLYLLNAVTGSIVASFEDAISRVAIGSLHAHAGRQLRQHRVPSFGPHTERPRHRGAEAFERGLGQGVGQGVRRDHPNADHVGFASLRHRVHHTVLGHVEPRLRDKDSLNGDDSPSRLMLCS